MLVAKPHDLNLIPRTHTAEKTSFHNLASDLSSHTHAHKINKCKRNLKALTATSMIITSNKTSPTTCSHRKGRLSVPMPLLEPSFWSLALKTWAPGAAQSLSTSSPPTACCRVNKSASPQPSRMPAFSQSHTCSPEAVVALAGLGAARRVLFPDNFRGKFGLCSFPGLLGNVCRSVWQLCPMAEAKNPLNKQPAAYTEQSGRTASRLGSILPGCSLPGATFCLFQIRWRAFAEPAAHPSLAEPAAHPPVKSQKKGHRSQGTGTKCPCFIWMTLEA